MTTRTSSRLGSRSLLLGGLLLASVALADGTSVITGTVTDTANAPLADVIVTATSPALSAEEVVVTDAAGGYRLSRLPSGSYQLTFEKEGFLRTTRADLVVRADRTLRFNPQLQRPPPSEMGIVISGRPPTVDVGATAQGISAPPNASGVRWFESLAAVEPQASGEDYGRPTLNAWTLTSTDQLSTFGADVDTASYTLARAKLLSRELPPAESVRVEEWLNYFTYTYPQPEKGAPLSVSLDAAPSPFNPHRTLLRVGVQGRTVDRAERKPAHLTFLVDVSGSMNSPERLPLAKRALRMLVDQLHGGDTVALVTYAGTVRLVLPHTGLQRKAEIHAAIEQLSADGSTSMNAGIDLAYRQAMKVLDSKSSSRVIVLSDGDANVGATSHEQILAGIAGHVKEGVTLTTVGFGMGNYKSVLMEQLADRGNGNHFYVDSLLAAKRIFVEQLGGTLETIAQDVKLQVDFDPAQVHAYRLLGYENRDIADRDFRNDRVDAGEIGSGHRVTALYELELKAGAGQGLATVHLRAKAPRGTTAEEKHFVFGATNLRPTFDGAPADFRFATAVMGAAEIFRRSPEAAEWSYELVRRIAREATPSGNAEREEFNALLERARSLAQLAKR